MPKLVDFDRKILNRAAPKEFATACRTEAMFSCEAKGDDSATLRFYDTIGPDWIGMIGAETVAKALDSVGDVKNLHVRINSGGGDVFEGLAIYNQLVQHPANVTVTIDGLAASIASVIAMAGDTVNIAKNSRFMIHPPSGVVFGGAKDMRDLADLLDSIQASITGVYQDRTGLEESQLTDWINAETWMTAEEAVERGFADGLVENKAKKKDDDKKEKPKAEEKRVLMANEQLQRLSIKAKQELVS